MNNGIRLDLMWQKLPKDVMIRRYLEQMDLVDKNLLDLIVLERNIRSVQTLL